MFHVNEPATKPRKKHDYPVRYDTHSKGPHSYVLAESATANLPSGIECQAMLKAARKARGLTQGAIAYILGVPVRNINHWEHGRTPSAAARRRIFEVCRALGVS